MPQSVERIEPVEPGLHLPRSEGELDAALADSDTGLRAEEGITRLQPFATSALVPPEFPKFTHQRIRQENIARSAALGDLGADSQASPRHPIIYIDIPHGEPYNLRQP